MIIWYREQTSVCSGYNLDLSYNTTYVYLKHGILESAIFISKKTSCKPP